MINRPCALAIDIGTSAVKVLAAEFDESHGMEIKGSGCVPASGFYKGSFVDMPSLAITINQAVDCALTAAGIAASQAFVGVSGNALQSYNSIGNITLTSSSRIGAADIEKACSMAVSTVVPDDYEPLDIIPTSFWLDGNKLNDKPLGMKGNRLEVEVHVTAFPKALYAELQAILAQAGITVAGFSANTIAASANVPDLYKEDSFCIDLGAGQTDIALYRQGHLRLSASLPLGGDYITHDIMQGLSIGQLQAENVKRNYGKLDGAALRGKDVLIEGGLYGAADKKVSYDFLRDIVESRILEIASLTYRYLQPAIQAYAPQRIFFTGGCSQMASVLSNFEQVFGLPVTALTLDTAREYAEPGNAASIGLLRNGRAKIVLPAIAVEENASGFLNKLKNVFVIGNRG